MSTDQEITHEYLRKAIETFNHGTSSLNMSLRELRDAIATATIFRVALTKSANGAISDACIQESVADFFRVLSAMSKRSSTPTGPKA
jgi:hypothetical protein